MTLKYFVAFSFLLSASLSPIQVRPAQDSTTTSTVLSNVYSNTPDGLQKLIADILRAAKDKNSAQEAELIHSLLLPLNSDWFTVEYGPGFGASLAAAYGRVAPGLEEEIKTIYEGNVERGWMTPELKRYAEPDAVDSPIDTFLNCMNKIAPLYQTAFHDGSTAFYMSQKPGDNLTQAAGDLNGFFVYDQGGFRFIPMNVLMKLPRERPVRITLGTNVMNSKLQTDFHLRYPEEAIRKRISGTVVVHLIIDTTGSIKEMKVIQGDPILSHAVIEEMRAWHFEPTRLDGDLVEVEVDWNTGFTSN
jgi:TonB family protein